MLKGVLSRSVPKEIEVAILQFGKDNERYPSMEELSWQANISVSDADSYLRRFKKQMEKMR
ncbi:MULTISPECIES: hypothetical protein [unclassified Sporolactobacillus]|uniref:hypothetical protein n=1 Tax=unclassified Sporolactobacillus TaxID=2628533 RepID=UPI002368411E|nr:hypothetical protein [Sporolactobacillus sp. CQH2019]MDD9150479.1 hypothetical protein [Sporolactobacillus sp. CQH2019]